MPKLQRIVGFALVATFAAVLAACSGAPGTQSIVADDDALCRYSAGAVETAAYRQCRARLDKQRAQQALASATQVEVSQSKAVALVRTPTTVAACTAQNKAVCAEPSDITGTIPAQPKNGAPKP